MNVVVTGAAGFIGRRVVALARRAGHDVVEITRADSADRLATAASAADAVIHLAGVNRPSDPAEFTTGNAEYTERLCAAISDGRAVVVFASSTQASLENPYGVSKRRGEQAVDALAQRGGRAVTFRLPNVFGPGGRPHYNSAVATFAHNAAHGLPLDVHDASKELVLVYVHDVAAAMLEAIARPPAAGTNERREVAPVYRTTVGALAEQFRAYGSSRDTLLVPEVSTELGRRLYATYLSFLAPGRLAYDLKQHVDDRGALAEFLKSDASGQIFVSRTKPGITRGNHYHHSKTEKFLVLDGDAVVRFRRVDGTGDVQSYPVSGRDFRVIDIPPDHTHSIENVGTGEMIVLFWASEIFDPKTPDTMPLNVLT